jgi:hypothetical protein
VSLHKAVRFVCYSATIGANRKPLCAKWPSLDSVCYQCETADAAAVLLNIPASWDVTGR